MSEPLLRVENLRKYYDEGDSLLDRLLRRDSEQVRAVDGVSFEIHEGETLGLVGESGCGKSTTAETLLRLREPTDGTVIFDGMDVFELDDLLEFRREAQIVFQDPFSSLDPRMTAGEIILEALRVHDWKTPAERTERVVELLELVGLSEGQFDRYPHEFSGGQRQRIGIARALALEPKFLVLDEPVSALDVSVQAQILNLLDDLQDELGLSYLLIAHDLSVVRHIADSVGVMYLGEIVEIGPGDAVFEDPEHPYTRALLESVPRAEAAEADRDVEVLQGDVPSPRDPPSGCRFRTRCPEVIPPDDLGLTQRQYRAVMDLRHQIEQREINEQTIQAATAVTDVDADADASADGGRAAGSLDAADALADRLLSIELPGDHHSYLRDALAAVTEDRYETAADKLRDRYGSVCEQDNPQLEPRGQHHPVACHLYQD